MTGPPNSRRLLASGGLLLAILCTMIFGPAPVLILAGVGVVLAAFAAMGAGIGETVAAIRRVLSPRRSKSASAASIAEARAASDAQRFEEWAARNPLEATRAKAAEAA